MLNVPYKGSTIAAAARLGENYSYPAAKADTGAHGGARREAQSAFDAVRELADLFALIRGLNKFAGRFVNLF